MIMRIILFLMSLENAVSKAEMEVKEEVSKLKEVKGKEETKTDYTAGAESYKKKTPAEIIKPDFTKNNYKPTPTNSQESKLPEKIIPHEFGKRTEPNIEKSKTLSEDELVNQEYAKIEEKVKPVQDAAPTPPIEGRIKAAISNIGNIAKNGFDNTVGYGIAKFQNYKTEKHFKNNPDSKAQAAYLMHGMMQNEGSQWRLAKELRKQGLFPLHLKGNHKDDGQYSADKAIEQLDSFYDKTKMKKGSRENDIFSGHSSGANTGIYLSGDSRTITDYGIGAIQARAPTPTGIKTNKTLGQKLLMPFAKADNTNTMEGKINAVNISKIDPKVDVHIVAGKYDALVTPGSTYFTKAKSHTLIDHKDSTHFGTSGVNKDINKNYLIPHMKYIAQGENYQVNKAK